MTIRLPLLIIAAVLALIVPRPAAAEMTLRIAMTAADIPLTTGQPDQGFEGYRFAGYTIYDALVIWDLSHADQVADITPGLASEWHPLEGDPKKWIFTLRQGVKFHDGSDFDADAVVWNLDKILNNAVPQYDSKQAAQVVARIPTVTGYRAVNKYTVEITNRSVNALLPYDMSYVFYSSPKRWEEVGRDWNKFATRPAGTGPFIVDKFVARERLELVKNASYWNPQRVPKVDRVVLLPISEASTRTAALLSGQVDWIEAPAPDSMARLKQSGMSIILNKYPHNWAYQPSMLDDSPFKDVRVRKAANLAIDRDGMTKLLGGAMLPGAGQVYPGHPWFGKASFEVKYDPVAAKKLLAEAGYGPAKKPKVKVAISTSGSGQMQPLPMNEFVQQNLVDVGFEVEFEVMEWNALTAVGRTTAEMPEMKGKGINAINISRATVDPYSAFTRLFGSQYVPPRGANWGLLKDPELDALLDKAQSSFDLGERTKLLAEAHGRIVDQAYWIWIAHDLNPRAISPKVKGFVQAQSWFQDLTPVTVQ
jgi:peptide/nickel transport system substrate-binding protein